MAAGKPWAPIRGKRMRLTRLSDSLTPVVGTATTGVSDGFVSVKITPEYDDGDKIQLKNANGDYCINEIPTPVLTGVGAEIQFCGVNADYLSMITNFDTVLDFETAAVGLRMSGGVEVTGGYALEVWTGLSGGGGSEFGYLLLPALKGGKIGEFTIENGNATFTVTSNSSEGSKWGTGPYMVVGSGTLGATPSKLLTAIGAKDHIHLQRTTLAPPAVVDGLVELAAA